MDLKYFALIFLFALFFSSIHEIEGRDSQMFNKIPSKTNDVVVEVKQPQQNLPNKEQVDEQPNFIPENTENSYGLYGHESGQFPPSTQTQPQNINNNNLYQTNPNPQNNFPTNAKYLPKNYNTVAYVTQPEDFNDNTKDNNAQKDLNNEFDFVNNEEGSSVNNNNNNNFNTRFMDTSATTNTNTNSNNYYNAQGKDTKNEFDFLDTQEGSSVNDNNYFNNDNANANNKYYNNDVVSNNNNNFNTRFTDNNNNHNNNYYNNDVVSNNNNNFNTRFVDVSNNNNNNNADNYYASGKSRVNRVEPQGMSDTRFVENGKYHFDINTGKYSRDHPYVNPMAMRNQYNPTSTGYNNNNVDNSFQYNNYNEEVEQYQNEDNMP